MRTVRGTLAAVVVGGLALLPALASGAQDQDGGYVWGGGLFEFADGARESDDGRGFVLGGGMPLSALPGQGLELSFKNLARERRADGNKDYERSLFLDWVHHVGGDWVGGARPFVVLGAGGIQEDVLGDKHLHFGLDTGVGALFALPFHGWALRAQFMAQGQLNDKSAPGEDLLIDFNAQLGLHIPLRWGAAAPRELPPEVPVCQTRVVDPVTGRADCIADADRDGVSDADDACPATPAGTAVDVKGCTIVGIVIDSDGDGVVDDADACPGTPVGMIVDATGCLIEQTVTLRSINFEPGSAVLTSDARVALGEVARTLKNQRNLNVEITGHTDNQGNDQFNLMLSQQRAELVRQYLISKSVRPERLIAQGMGEQVPVADNDTESGREANRRVEFKVTVQ